jgi:putative oxidoreductase
MKKFFLLSFVPTNIDLGLLLLRLGTGGLLALLHGWGKVTGFSKMFDTFPDPLGIGARASYLLATGGEFIGGIMVALGLFARFGALWAGSVMGVAFFVVHKGALTGPQSGELGLLYLAGFLAILFTGAGRFSFDAKLGGK